MHSDAEHFSPTKCCQMVCLPTNMKNETGGYLKSWTALSMVTVLILQSCDSDKTGVPGKHQPNEKVPISSKEKSRKSPDPAVPEAILVMQRKKSWGDFTELNREVKIVADKKGVTYGEALNEIYQAITGDVSDQEAKSLAEIFAASHGRESDLLISSLSVLPAGILRTVCTSYAVGNAGSGDSLLLPLEKAYDSMGESSDRSIIAKNYANWAFYEKGAQGGIAALERLTTDEKIEAMRYLAINFKDEGSNPINKENLERLREYAEKEGLLDRLPHLK